MSGWKFTAEFRRGRKEPFALKCFVAVPDVELARTIAAQKLIGADAMTAAEKVSKAELLRLNIGNGQAVIR